MVVDMVSNGFKVRGTHEIELTNQVHHTSTWLSLKTHLLHLQEYRLLQDNYG
jgi:hypothetical protein